MYSLSDIIMVVTIYIISQIIGVIAIIFSLSIYQVNKRQSMLLLSLVAALLFSLHYWLLGAATGAALNLLAVGRCYVFYKVKPSHSNRWIVYLFIGLDIFVGALTWQGLISLLPMAGSIGGIISGWQQRPKLIRRYALIPPPLWFVYSMLSGSIPGMFIGVFRFISNLVGQYRFDFRHKAHIRHKLAHPA